MAKQIAPGSRTSVVVETDGAGTFGRCVTEYRVEDGGAISPCDAIVEQGVDTSLTVASLWQAKVAAIKSQEGIA